MNRRPAPLLTVCALLATLVLAALLVRRFEDRAGALRANHQQQLVTLQKQWASEDAARKVAAHEEALRRQRAHQRELEQALGGPTEVPARNPDLNIQQMLEQTARACAPAGASVVVRVDRFTEFEVIVTLKGVPGPNQLAELTTCLLRHGAPYVHTLRFIQGARVIAELDQRALELVPDWSQASVTTAQQLLASSGLAAPSPVAAANDAQPPSAKEDSPELTGDRKRLQEVDDAFYRARTNQFDRLNKLIEAQDFAARLPSVGRASDLDERLKWLGDNESALDSARAFFLNPEPEYRRLLNEQNFDPLMVTILCRGLTERGEQQRPYLTRLLDAVAERQRITKSFLAAMQSQWGNWHGNPATGRIYFDPPRDREAQEAYNRGSAQYERASHAVELAARAWSDFNAAQKNKP
jgi:hypothetical protein